MLHNVLYLVLLILIIDMILENHFFGTTFYKVKADRLPKEWDGKRILLLSDLHNNQFGKKNEKLITKIKELKPDALLIAGDMLIGHSDVDNTIAKELVCELAASFPVYYGKGNHEQKLSQNPLSMDSSYREYVEDLERAGVRYLINETVKLWGANVVGLDIAVDFYRKRKRPKMDQEYLESIIGTAESDQAYVMIAHNPMYFQEYAKWGADLVLSGHVHGGIARIPGLGGVISPQYIFFPHYDAGHFEEGNSTMILSRGLGAHTIKLRLFNHPELVVLDFYR